MDYSQLTRYRQVKRWQDLPWNTIKLKANLYLPKFVVLLFVILLVQTAAELTWKLISPQSSSEIVSGRVKPTSQRLPGDHRDSSLNSPVNRRESLSSVSQYHLFGEANRQPVIRQQVINAPETRLSLTLKGVFASSDEKQAMAIISTSKGKDITYHIGAKISGDALLHAVYADRVILKRNGQFETLRLPKAKFDSDSLYSVSEPDIVSKNEISLPDNSPESGQDLNSIRETLLKDPAKVWQQVRINPVMEEGRVKGYTLVHDDQAFMASINIRPSDIITEIDGDALSDPATLYELMNNLAEKKTLQVTLERNGQVQTIELNFQQSQ